MLTKQDIFDLVEEEDVRFIRLQFTDMLGTMRNLAITTSRLEDVYKRQSNTIFFICEIFLIMSKQVLCRHITQEL